MKRIAVLLLVVLSFSSLEGCFAAKLAGKGVKTTVKAGTYPAKKVRRHRKVEKKAEKKAKKKVKKAEKKAEKKARKEGK